MYAISDSIGAKIDSATHRNKRSKSKFIIVSSHINLIKNSRPIQQHHIPQRNPMFRVVGRILSFIPLKLHARQPMAVMVNKPLTGGRL